MLFKIRDASGERKYLITASNLTEYYSIVCLDFFSWGGGFLTLLMDVSFPTLGNLIPKF